MGTKKWYASKTIWSGIVGILIVVYNALIPALAEQCGVEGSICLNIPAIPEFVYAVLGFLGVYGRKSATTKVS